MRIVTVLVSIGILIQTGCIPSSPSSATPTGTTPVLKTDGVNNAATDNPAPPVRPLKSVINPRYQSWADKKVGAQLTIVEKTETPNLRTEARTVYQLKSVSPEQVVVVVTSEIVQPDGTKIPTPAQEMTYPKMMQVDEKHADDPLRPQGTTSSRKEEITILGKKYEANVYQSQGRVEAGETQTQTWVVAVFPGCVVKTTHTIPAMKKTVTSDVVTFSEN